MIGTSRELQDVTMAALVKFPEIFAKTLQQIDETYFSNMSYRLIYKCLVKHYAEHLVLPSKIELALLLRELHTPEYGVLSEYSKTLDYLIDSDLSSEDFAFDKVIDYIKRVQGERALEKVLQSFDGKNINLDSVISSLSDAMTVNVTKTTITNLADITDLDDIKTEALGDSQSPVLIKFFIDALNKALEYGGFIPGTVNVVAAPPGTGKTTLLLNQGLCVAQQGYKVLHIYLGDMTKFDAKTRYISIVSGIITKKLVKLPTKELAKFIQKYNMTGFLSNIDILAYAADELTANQLIEEIKIAQKNKKTHYDFIIVDYDENLAYEDSDMYKSGGLVYNKLAFFARYNSSVIFVASQPKTEYSSHEILPMECLAESSKKQKIVDLVLTMGRPSKGSGVATLHVAKNRRGNSGNIYRLRTDGDTGRYEHITEDEYIRIKQSERGSGGNNVGES